MVDPLGGDVRVPGTSRRRTGRWSTSPASTAGAFLCDGVGLGKTYVGLLLLERLVLHENKRVVLFAPKSVKDSVWVPELKKHLPHIGGVDGSADFSNLSVFSFTR